MSNTPILGLLELVFGQAVPEQTVNENTRVLEFFASGGAIEDRDLLTPAALTPADGDAYLIDGTGAGDWTGEDNNIALYVNTDWIYIAPSEGMVLYVKDEDVRIVYDGSAWALSGTSGGTDPLATAPLHVANFTADGEVRFYADVGITLTQQSTSGTGSVAYEKSTAAAPSTFSSTTSPITLEAGAWLKITASSVTDLFAVALKRTA